MKEAADILSQSPCAMQLRYLQTLNGIATEQNSTIIFPLPVDLFTFFQRSQLDVNQLPVKSPTTKLEKSPAMTNESLIPPPTTTDI